jgi:hypothetical protein
MKCCLYIAFSLLLLACRQDRAASPIMEEAPVIITPTQLPLTSHTLRFEKPAPGGPDDILIYVLKDQEIPDGGRLLDVRFDFRLKGHVVYSERLKVDDNRSERGEWYLSEGYFDSEGEVGDPHIFALNFGYGACGYTQTAFIYHTSDGKILPFDRIDWMTDSGYGVRPAFTPVYVNGALSEVGGCMIEVEPDTLATNENGEPLLISYRDSVSYELRNGRWTKKYITKKGIPYRQEHSNFETYYGTE